MLFEYKLLMCSKISALFDDTEPTYVVVRRRT